MGCKRKGRQGPDSGPTPEQGAKGKEKEAEHVLRGFVSGGLLGLVVSGVTLGTASLVGPQPAGTRPPMAPQVDAPGMAEGSGDIIGGTPDALPGGSTGLGGAPAPSQTPEVAMPEVDSVLPDADTASPVAPVAAEAEPGLAPPSAATQAPDIIAGAEAPVLPNPLARAPEPPVAEAAVQVPDDPTTPPPSDVPPTQPTTGLEQPALPEIALLVDPATPEAAPVIVDIAPNPVPDAVSDANATADSTSADRPVAEVESVANQPVVATPVVPPTVPDAQSDAAPVADAAAPSMAAPTAPGLPPAEAVEIVPEPEAVGVEVVVETVVEPVTEPLLVEPETEPVPEDPEPAEPATQTEPAEPRIALQGSGSTLPGNTQGVRVTRPADEAVASAQDAPAEAAEEVFDEDAPALVRYASDYDNPDGKPLMSIILIDDGGLGGGAVAAVGAVPFPVTVAIDALAPDAADKMAAYRAAGVEVMALASLPEGALPSDVEVTLEAAFSALPETIALLDVGAGGLQSDRGVTEQAMAHLAQAGRGFVTQSQGLNMALRSAEAADVPAAVIYRNLDSEDQDARVIRRFLDQAAFRARQQSGVVLVGRVRADTISALSLWGTANRAGQVTFAPVSAALLIE